MTRVGTLAMVVVLWLGATVGCSSGNGGGGAAGAGGGAAGAAGGAAGSAGTASGSGVDGTKLVSALTSAEKGKICDWFAGLVGGYGMSNTCGMGSFYPPDTQTNCVQQFSTCDAKVSDLEACTKSEADSEKMCTDTAVGAARMTAACMAVLAAGC
jgi:hypothetical protein